MSFDNEIGSLYDMRSSSDVASKILCKMKKSMKGKKFVLLVNPEFPKAVFEVEARKYNKNPKRYKLYRFIGERVCQ